VDFIQNTLNGKGRYIEQRALGAKWAKKMEKAGRKGKPY
jgi:hypothetical protein